MSGRGGHFLAVALAVAIIGGCDGSENREKPAPQPANTQPSLDYRTVRPAPRGPAGPRWDRIQLVAPSRRIGSAKLGFDRRGTTYLAWSGSGQRVSAPPFGPILASGLALPRIALRARGAADFGPPERLSRSRAGLIDLAVAANGAAVAVWEVQRGMQVAVRQPGALFGNPKTYRRSNDSSAHPPTVSMADDGSALITWPAGDRRPLVLYRDGRGLFKRVPGLDRPQAYDLIADVNNRGAMALLWSRSTTDGGTSLLEMTKPVGEPWGDPRRVPLDPEESPSAQIALDADGGAMIEMDGVYAFCPTDGKCEGVRGPPRGGMLVADRDGGMHLIWSRRVPGTSANLIHDSMRSQGGDFQRPMIVARAREASVGPAADGPRDQILVTWTARPRPGRRREAIYSSLFSDSGWGKPRRVTPAFEGCPGCNTLITLDVEVDPVGRAAVAFVRRSPGRLTGELATVRMAGRMR